MVHPVRNDGSVDYSRVIDCPSGNCIEKSYAAYRRGDTHLAAVGISPKKQKFEDFQQITGVKETYKKFKDLATGDASYMMLLCYGGTGNGKTHLCNSLALVLLDRGVTTKLYTVSDMVSELRSGIENNTIEPMIQKLKQVEALILDDYKPEYGSVWEMNRVEEIIDARYRNALITVLTTNRGVETVPERITSRFMDPALGVIILNEATDFRKRRVRG